MTPGFASGRGIARRHLAENETTSYMAGRGGEKRALAQSDIPAEDVDLILVATSTPENVFFHARHVRYKERFMQSMRRDLI